MNKGEKNIIEKEKSFIIMFGVAIFSFLFLISLVSAEEFGYNYLEGELNVVQAINYTEISVNDSLLWDGNAWSDTRWLEIDGSNANTNINIGAYDFYANDGFFDYLNFSYLFSNFGGGIDATGDPWYLSGTDLQIAENLLVDGNITANWINADYFSGQPLDGSIGSGIINSSNNEVHCGCINTSDEGGLDVKYPDLKVRIWNYGTTKYCDITGTTVTVPDDAHTVYYVNSSCDVASMSWANYFAQDINPTNYVRIFDVFTQASDIEVLKGGGVLGLMARKSKFGNVNCGGGGHLSICDGMAITEGTFPEINMSSGHFKYVSTVHTSVQRDSNPDGLHVVCESDGSHTADTEIDIDECDTGAGLGVCTSDKYRRYIIYDIGWGVTHTAIHQLAPLDSDTYTTLANCINTEKNPLSYTLPSNEDGVAVVLAFYCGKRDDTAWGNGWVDVRAGINGFGAVPDLSGFVPYIDANKNVDLGSYNLTIDDTLKLTNTTTTWNMYVDVNGTLVWEQE